MARYPAPRAPRGAAGASRGGGHGSGGAAPRSPGGARRGAARAGGGDAGGRTRAGTRPPGRRRVRHLRVRGAGRSGCGPACPAGRAGRERRRGGVSALDRRPGVLVLVDPGRATPAAAVAAAQAARSAGAAGGLIGSSFDGTRETHAVARAIPEAGAGVPGVLFPRPAVQPTQDAGPNPFPSPPVGRRPPPPAAPAAPAADVALFVGGGIRTPEQARAARVAGADFVVIGTAVEDGGAATTELAAFVRAVTE